MNRIDQVVFRWLVYTAATAAAITLAARADTVMLKTEAYVKGKAVTLGDIADIQGEHAEALASIELAPVPAPGATRRFDPTMLRLRIRGAGLDPGQVEICGAPSAVAKTLELEVSPQVIADDLRTFIETQMPWDADETAIDIELPQQAMVLPDGALGIKWWPNPQYRWVGPAVFRGEVSIDGQTQRTVHLKAMVEAYANVLVAATDIPRGKTLSPNDVMLEKRALSSVRGDAVQSLEEAVGLVTRSSVLAGQIITSRSLLPRQLIKRNQMVNVETRVGGLVVRGRARSLMNAVEGDVVTCVNTESKEEFQGVVRGDGVVVVQ